MLAGTTSARSVLERHLAQLVAHLPAVRDGDEEAIHAARVATRRAREALVSAAGEFHADPLEDTAQALRRAGRSLGVVRDADVMFQLLLSLDTRVPSAAAALGTLRAIVARERQSGRRRVIKELEALHPARRLEALRSSRRHSAWRLGITPWRSTLRDHLLGRSVDVRVAVQHGSGVYFPNRSHATRIAIKKLRYALELAAELRAWRVPKALRRLRRAQDTLGQVRDRQLLIQRLRSEPMHAADVEPAVAALEGEIMALHEIYAEMRNQILDSCDRIDAAVRPRHRTTGALAALALPSIIVLGRQLRRQEPHVPADARAAGDVRLQIHLP